jgi:hypothetical protein
MNSWKEFLNLKYAMALANAMLYCQDHSHDSLTQAIVARKIADDFHHGITPNTRRMEAPLL